MSGLSETIGRNILYFRLLRGMTQRALCDTLAGLGDDPVTVQTLSYWEHGTRSISAEHLYYLSKALEVLPMELYDGDQAHAQDRARAVIQAAGYSEHEREILRYAALDWPGDSHALIEWIGAYMAMPPEKRADAADYLIYIYESVKSKGLNRNVPYTTDARMLRRKVDILEET